MSRFHAHTFLEPYLRRWIYSSAGNNHSREAREKSLSFMIVEDDELIKNSVVGDLRERGYKAEGVSDVAPVPRILKKMTPTVLAVDYYLGDDNGVTLYDTLLAKNALNNSVFMLISAYPKVEELARMRGIPYLEKPFSVDDLVTKAFAAASYHTYQEKGKITHLLEEVKELFTADL